MKQIFALAVLVLTLSAPSLAESGCRGCGRTRCHQPVKKVLKLVARPFHRCCR